MSHLARGFFALTFVIAPISAHASEPASPSPYEAADQPVEIALADGVSVRLEPGARVQVYPPVYVPAERGGKALRGFHVQVRRGALSVRVPDDQTSPRAVLVSTPNGSVTTAWRGLHAFSFEQGTAVVASYEGSAQVGSASHFRLLASGRAAVVRAHEPPDLQHTLLDAPAWRDSSSPPPTTVVPPSASAPVGAAWSPAPGAVEYAYEVGSDPSLRTLVARGRTSGTSFATAPLPAGTYYARVHAIGADGIAGAPSATKVLRVQSPTLPPGAFVAKDGTIVLPRSGALSLEGLRGVQVSTFGLRNPRWTAPSASMMHFGPAPASVGLEDDEEAKVVYFREPASGSEATMRLARSELRAEVEMLPKRARWPEDPVQIIVRVTDPSGRADVSSVSLALKTQVNLDEEPVTWSHKGDAWATVVKPRVPPGPWVVRVQAFDEATGVQLGAGVLEVDGPFVTNHPALKGAAR
jgi:hypothetical protein